jgi:uncharacterized membrane protein
VEIPILFFKTVLLRPYVFVFLAAFLFVGKQLLGWKRTSLFFFITWGTAFICEFSSTRTGVPFGWYQYTGSTVREELYISNVPFMDSLSFTFLLFASYCVGLAFLLPSRRSSSRHAGPPDLLFDHQVRSSWPVLLLTALLFSFIDVVIDPVALRGERWFLGKIYWYPDPGVHFGVPVANYVGWLVVGLLALSGYFYCDRRLVRTSVTSRDPSGAELNMTNDAGVTGTVLLGCALYYGVLIFNLTITFWIGEPLIGMTGVFMFIPVTVLLLLRLLGHLPAAAPVDPQKDSPDQSSS